MADLIRVLHALVATLAWWALIVFIVASPILVVFDFFAQRAAEARDSRLQLVWPDLFVHSHEDRQLLHLLAAHCRVSNEPLRAAAVVGCLQRAAADPAFIPPHGVVDAAIELRRLLGVRRRPPAEVPQPRGATNSSS